MNDPTPYLFFQLLFVLLYWITIYMLVNSFDCLYSGINRLIHWLNMNNWHSPNEFLAVISVIIISVLIWWVDYTLWIPVIIITGIIFSISFLIALCK